MKQPWEPFQTRSEFEFAEVAFMASLSKNQVNVLIQIIKRCINGEDKFEIRSHAHMLEIWNEWCDSAYCGRSRFCLVCPNILTDSPLAREKN